MYWTSSRTRDVTGRFEERNREYGEPGVGGLEEGDRTLLVPNLLRNSKDGRLPNSLFMTFDPSNILERVMSKEIPEYQILPPRVDLPLKTEGG